MRSTQRAISRSSSVWIPLVRPNGCALASSIASSRLSARISPSTGPKHSVRWKKDARSHAELDAGRPELRVVRAGRGSSSHSSPSSSTVSARRSAAPGGWVSGVIRLVSSHALPDGEAGGGVAELAPEVGVVVHLGLADGEAGRRALLAVVAEGRADEIADGLVAIRERRDDDGVLAARLREQRQIGPPAEEEARRLHRAGEDDAAHAGVRHQPAADLVVGAGQELEDVARDAGLPQAAGQLPADEHRLGRRLEHDGVAGRERGEHAAGGDGQREVPGRGHDHHAERLHAAIAQLGGAPRAAPGRSSARSRPPRRPRRPPPSRSWRRRGSSRRSGRRAAARARPRTPRAGPRARRRGAPPTPAAPRGRPSARDRRRRGRPARSGRRRGRAARDRARLPSPRARAELAADLERDRPPASRSRQRATTSSIHARLAASVQSVSGSFSNSRLEATRAGGATASAPPILGAAGRVGEAGLERERGQEAIALGDPVRRARLEVEDVTQEVLGRGVLVQPADQVGDGAVEVLRADDGRVEQQARRRAPAPPAPGDWPCLRASRTRPRARRRAVLAQHEAVGDVEEVVAGHAQVDGLGVLGPAAVLEHALVVGVHLGLASRRAPGASRAPRPRCAPWPGSRP